ncbi:MAG: sulfatase-like hydrolase/transferase [Phycisphaerae bacterium]|nr:sulfatase-like hydrolase/transferase [Phycisphaerae bacterium]
MSMQPRAWVIGMTAGILATGAGCREEQGKPSGAVDVSRHNVLLITLDTTRADVLACYGHKLVKTPNLDRLAREGARFTQCTTVAPITLPAHTSILAGTYPFVHGVRNNGRYVPDEGITTLAEWLKGRGFATGAEVAAFVLDGIWGLNQGFDTYQSAKPDETYREQMDRLMGHQSVPADDVADRAIAWLNEHNDGRFFLWLHFFDPHQPWRPPDRFKEQYPHPYLGEVAFMDEQIGRVLDELRRLKLDGRTLVAVVGDHGEGLGQHDELTHRYYVYDSTMRVPLLMWGPGVVPAGRVVASQARTVDVAPTVLDLLGLEPLPRIQGCTLRPLLDGRTADLGLAAYGESVEPFESYGYSRLWAIRSDGWKYIHAPRAELYDVRKDPQEETNLAEQEPERLSAMRERLESVVSEGLAQSPRQASSSGALDAGLADRLGGLGYVGGYAPPAETDELTLLRKAGGSNPKDHIQTVNGFLKARAHFEANQLDEGETILHKLIGEEPENPALRSVLARMYWEAGRPAEAWEQYAVLLKLQPENAPERYRAGRVLGGLGRFRESEACLREAVEAMPGYADARAYLALIMAEQGRAQEARTLYEEALAAEPGCEACVLGLSGLLQTLGDRAGAIRVLRAGLEQNSGSFQMANNLAWWLATAPDESLRNGADAVRLAEQTRDTLGDRASADILDTLAAAYAEVGRTEDAAAVARRAIELAERAANTELADDIRARLALYEGGRAYRDGG